jgi:hypothetical protein
VQYFLSEKDGSTKLFASRNESLQPVSFAESIVGCLHPDGLVVP